MEHAEVILHLLLPTDEDPTESVHPTVGPLDDPAAGLEPPLLLQRLRLLASGPHGGREPQLRDQLSGVGVVITLLQAHPPGLVLPRFGAIHGEALHPLPAHTLFA